MGVGTDASGGRGRAVAPGSGRVLDAVVPEAQGDPRLDDIADLFAAAFRRRAQRRRPTPDKHKGVDHAVDDKQRRIQELSTELEEARADAANLRSTLTSLGIRFY